MPSVLFPQWLVIVEPAVVSFMFSGPILQLIDGKITVVKKLMGNFSKNILKYIDFTFERFDLFSVRHFSFRSSRKSFPA